MPSPFDEINEAEIRERCAALLNAALDEAVRLHHNYIGTEHLYNAITKVEGSIAAQLLREAMLDPRVVRNEVRREVGAGDDDVGAAPPLTPRARRVLATALYYADDYNSRAVNDVHILIALLQDGEGVAVRKLRALGVNTDAWIEKLLLEMEHAILSKSDSNNNNIRSTHVLDGSVIPTPSPNINNTPLPDKTSPTPPTPLLDKFGRDLVALAKGGRLTPAIGREREIQAVARTLTRNKKNNPLLLGDAGVGKTAVIEGLAYNIAEGTAPHTLTGKRIIQLEISNIVAGTSLRGQFEERLVGIVDEARTTPGIILFIDEIHTIVGAGDTIDSNLDAANILKPALSRGEIAVIGATTHEEYRKAILQDPALERRFHTVDIGEPSEADTLTIVRSLQPRYVAHHGVEITDEAIEASVKLSGRYLINRRQPDKALDLLDEACARVVIHSGAALDHPRIVTAVTIAEVLAEWTGIPVHDLSSDERLKYARMEQELAARVVGQDHAVRVVAEAIKTNRAGLSDPKRPVGVFLFLGPSGVGKTELAKALAAFMFGTEAALTRLDMSEFHDEHTIARLIGSPPGYKDSTRGGQLTEALRRHPYSVILLDEVEKAAPEVFDLFLQVFDDGRLTDSRGNPYDARHAVWIMTSNIGTAEAGKTALGFGEREQRSPAYEQHLKKFFRPEFLNRLDEVVIFNALQPDALHSILELQLAHLRERLTERGLSLQITPEAEALILQHGYEPSKGARPLRRTVERMLTRPISPVLLEGQHPPGSVIRVCTDGGAIQISMETTNSNT
jgi:ATP-dependent Clp protease ATP-binding subunit ClpC